MNHESSPPPPGSSGNPPPAALSRALAAGRVVELDARPLLEAGVEPFRAIMNAAGRLRPGEVLQLIVPFEPVPLHDVMAGRGLQRWLREPEPGSSEPWEVFYYPIAKEGSEEEPTVGDEPDDLEDSGETDLIDLDVRGLPPPEPLERVLALAGELAYGQVARVRHHRKPIPLFEILRERGFAWQCRETDTGDWEVRLWRRD